MWAASGPALTGTRLSPTRTLPVELFPDTQGPVSPAVCRKIHLKVDVNQRVRMVRLLGVFKNMFIKSPWGAAPELFMVGFSHWLLCHVSSPMTPFPTPTLLPLSPPYALP